MKRIIALLLVVTSLFIFGGCSKKIPDVLSIEMVGWENNIMVLQPKEYDNNDFYGDKHIIAIHGKDKITSLLNYVTEKKFKKDSKGRYLIPASEELEKELDKKGFYSLANLSMNCRKLNREAEAKNNPIKVEESSSGDEVLSPVLHKLIKFKDSKGKVFEAEDVIYSLGFGLVEVPCNIDTDDAEEKYICSALDGKNGWFGIANNSKPGTNKMDSLRNLSGAIVDFPLGGNVYYQVTSWDMDSDGWAEILVGRRDGAELGYGTFDIMIFKKDDYSKVNAGYTQMGYIEASNRENYIDMSTNTLYVRNSSTKETYDAYIFDGINFIKK